MAIGVEIDDLEAVPDAVRTHLLVVARAGRIGVEEQVELAARLGRVVGASPGVPQVRFEHDRGRHPDHRFFNERWHADLSWSAEGPTITLLYALSASRRAAPTAFVDTISGVERLPADLRTVISSWRAHHHVERSRILRYGRGSPAQAAPRRRFRPARPGHDAAVPTYVDEPGALHPVVALHAPSGRSGVTLGDHAWTLEGHSDLEGRRLVDELQARVVEAGDRYLHQWRRGDLVVFDNRTVLHRREPRAGAGGRRVLRRAVAWPDHDDSPGCRASSGRGTG